MFSENKSVTAKVGLKMGLTLSMSSAFKDSTQAVSSDFHLDYLGFTCGVLIESRSH